MGEQIEVTLQPVSLYGLHLRDDDLAVLVREKWLKEFFPDLSENSTEELTYKWRQKLYQLAEDKGLILIDYGDTLDFLLGVSPMYPWNNYKFTPYTTKESVEEAIIDFLYTYYDLSAKSLEEYKKNIGYINTVFMQTKGE